jgi:hypothetical protein
MSFSLKGKDWWGPFLACWLLVALGTVLLEVHGSGLAASGNPLLYFIVYVLFVLVAAAASRSRSQLSGSSRRGS